MKRFSRHAAVSTAAILAVTACGPEADPSGIGPSPGVPTSAPDHTGATGEPATAEPPTTGAPVTPSPDPTSTASLASAAINATIAIGTPGTDRYPADHEGLVAEYIITNTADQPIVVANGIDPLQSGRAVRSSDEESVWVTMDETGVVRLSKQIFDVDPRVLHESPYEANAIRLDPGESVTARAYASIPLQYVGPQETTEILFDGPYQLSSEAAEVQVCIEIAPATTGRDVIRHTSSGRELICSDPVALPEEARP